MRKIILLITIMFPVLGYAQTGTAIFQIDNGNIITNNQYVEMPADLWGDLRHILRNSITTTVGDVTYTIKTGRFRGWEEELGDFDVIEIFQNGTQKLVFKEGEGIHKYNHSRCLLPDETIPNKFASYAVNDYFIEVPLSSFSKALIFKGARYGTSLPRLTIFVLTENNAELVYCKKMTINSIIKTADEFSMQLQSNIPEGDNNAVTHTAWLENGTLWFKDN